MHNASRKFGASRDRGTVLLMALLIMSGIVSAAIGIGTLVMNALQQARVLDNSIVAYYAAESGVEEAVYAARRSDTTPTSITTQTALSNAATWTRTVTTRESVVYAGIINQDSIYEIQLYDPDASTTSQGIASVKVTWTDSCSGCSAVQASLVGWQSGGTVLWDPNAVVSQFPWNAGGATVSVPDASKLYRFRLTAKNSTLENVQIRAYDAGGLDTTIPGRLRIDAIGRYGNASQRLTATLPRSVPLSGIFDYVIFSECSLVKGGPSSSCP